MTTHKHGHYHIVGISEFHWHCNKFTLLKIKCSRSAFKHRLFTLSYTWIEFPIIWSELPSLEGDSCRAAAELCTVVKAFVSGSQQLPIHVQGLSQARQLHRDISVARGRHCRAAEGLKQLPGIKTTPRLSSNPALLSHLPYTKENSYINNFKGKYKPGKMCHCSRTHFWDTEKRPGAARCVPVNALGLFGLCRRAQSALAAGKWELTALPGHQQLLFTALQNPQPAEQGDHTPGYQHKSSAFLFAGIFYNMQSKLLLHSRQGKLKNHLVPLQLAVRKHARLFVLLPGKPIYLLSAGIIASRVSIGKAMTEVICLNLCCLLEGTANWCCKLRTSTTNF